MTMFDIKRNSLIKIIISAIVCVVILFMFHIYLLNNILVQNITTIGIASEYIAPNDMNSFINQIVGNDDYKWAYEVGSSTLREAGYRGETIKLLITDYMVDIMILMSFLLAVILGATRLYINRQKERIGQLHKVIDWINSDNIEFLEASESYYFPNEMREAIVMLKEKTISKYNMQEKTRESIVKYMENISHQLKTPLAVIRATSERVAMIHSETEERMLICQYQVDKMSALIRDFIQLGRFDCHRQKLKYEYVFAEEIIELLLNEMDTLIEENNLNIKVNGNVSVQWYCDIFWMQEILANVLKNCIEHSKDGVIHIDYVQKDQMNYIVIKDCGVGLEKGLEDKIFERFSTINRINTAGSGLGLSIAKEAINLHFGGISVKNRVPGGVEFRITFPQLDATNIYL